jgi:hypothetical protein
VESVPLPSEDNVLSTGQVGWDGDIVFGTVSAIMLLPDLEPLLLGIGLVTIIAEVDEAVADVKDSELDGNALGSASLEGEPVGLGHDRVAPANEVRIVGVDGCRCVLLIGVPGRRAILTPWFRVCHPSVSVHRTS